MKKKRIKMEMKKKKIIKKINVIYFIFFKKMYI